MSEVKEIIKMCKEVINGNKVGNIDCSNIGCENCPFSWENNKAIGCSVDSDENYVKIAKQYIEDHKDDELIWLRPKSISQVFEDITDRINKLDHNDTIKLLDEIDKLLIQYENKGV